MASAKKTASKYKSLIEQYKNNEISSKEFLNKANETAAKYNGTATKSSSSQKSSNTQKYTNSSTKKNTVNTQQSSGSVLSSVRKAYELSKTDSKKASKQMKKIESSAGGRKNLINTLVNENISERKKRENEALKKREAETKQKKAEQADRISKLLYGTTQKVAGKDNRGNESVVDKLLKKTQNKTDDARKNLKLNDKPASFYDTKNMYNNRVMPTGKKMNPSTLRASSLTNGKDGSLVSDTSFYDPRKEQLKKEIQEAAKGNQKEYLPRDIWNKPGTPEFMKIQNIQNREKTLGNAEQREMNARQNIGSWLKGTTQEVKDFLNYENAKQDIMARDQARRQGLNDVNGDIANLNKEQRQARRKVLNANEEELKKRYDILTKSLDEMSQSSEFSDNNMEALWDKYQGDYKGRLKGKIEQEGLTADQYTFDDYLMELQKENREAHDHMMEEVQAIELQLKSNQKDREELDKYDKWDTDYDRLMNPEKEYRAREAEINGKRMQLKYELEKLKEKEESGDLNEYRIQDNKVFNLQKEIEKLEDQNREDYGKYGFLMDNQEDDATYHPEYYNAYKDENEEIVRNQSYDTGLIDLIVDFVNGGEQYKDWYADGVNGRTISKEFSGAQAMLPEEIEQLTKLYNEAKKNGKDPTEAKAFFDALQPYLGARLRVYEEIENKSTAASVPILSSLYSGISSAITALPMAAATGIGMLTNAPWVNDPNNNLLRFTRESNDYETQVADMLGPVGGFIYKAGMSGYKNFLRGMMTSGLGSAAEAGTLVQFFGEAFNQSYLDKLEKTHDANASGAYAVVDAAISTLFEVASVEKMFSDPSDYLQYVLQNVGAEMSEEAFESMFGPYLHKLADGSDQWGDRTAEIFNEIKKNGGFTDVNGRWQTVTTENIGEAAEAARRQAMREWNQEILESTMSAALSVGGPAAFGAVRNTFSEHRENTDIGRTLLNAGVGENDTKTAKMTQQAKNEYQIVGAAAKMGPETESNKLAKEIEEDFKNGKRVSDAEFGKLAKSIVEESNDEVARITEEVLADKVRLDLQEQGVTENVSKLTGIVTKKILDQDLSDAEKFELSQSAVAKEIATNYGVGLRTGLARVADMGRVSEAAAEISKKTKGAVESRNSVMELLGESADSRNTEEKITSTIANTKVIDPKSVDFMLATGKRSGSAMMTLSEGKIADIKGISLKNAQDEDSGKDVRRFVVEMDDGRTVDISQVQATNAGTAQALKFLQGDQGQTIGNNLANTILQIASKDQTGNTAPAISSAVQIMWAAATETKAPRTNLSVADTNAVTEAVQKDMDAAEKKRLSGFREIKPGQGKTTYNGFEYGSREFNDALNNMNDTNRKEAQAIGSIAKSAGLDVELYYDESDSANQGSFSTGGGIRINLAGTYTKEGAHRSALATFAHEITHNLEANSQDAYRGLKRFIFNNLKDKFNLQDEIQRISDTYRMHGQDLDLNGAIAELVAKGSELVLTDEDVIRRLKEQDQGLQANVKNAVQRLIGRIRGIKGDANVTASRYAQALSGITDQVGKRWVAAYQEAQGAKGNATDTNGKEYSFMGTDPESGASIYLSNYPEGTQKTIKQKEFVENIQNVLSKNPVKLELKGYDGKGVRTIYAQFDPDFDPNNVNKTDAGKLAYNKKVLSNPENRVRLNLSGDLRTMLSESTNYDSKADKKGNTDIIQWHYFTDSIYYVAQKSQVMEPYKIDISIKEKKDGTFVYTYEAIKDESREQKKLSLMEKISSVNAGGKTGESASASDDIVSRREAKHNSQNSFQEDSDYMAAVERGDTSAAQRMVDDAAKRAGYTEKVYHGTPTGGFTVFKDWSYFTKNKAYADRYQNASASSIRGSYETTNPQTYELYMNPGKVFDTRDPEAAKLYNEARMEYGLGELSNTDSGLPDWTDGRDIIEFIEDRGLDYDTILLDEGGDPGDNGPVKRGISYVTRSNRVKNAESVTYDDNGNVIPLSERFNTSKDDIRYSFREDDAEYKKLQDAYVAAGTRTRELRDQIRKLDKEGNWEKRIRESSNDEVDAIVAEFERWDKETGYGKLKNDLKEAEEAEKAAKKAYDDYVEKRDVAEEQEKIRESGLSEADWRRKQAVKSWGYTTNYKEAGYLLPDGKMLNFSGEKGRHTGHRGQDHRAIGYVYASGDIQGSPAMYAFMNDGNIRVMAESPGIDISTENEPTAAQYAKIRDMASRFAEDEEFYVDLSDENGRSIGNFEYEGKINPSRIVNDIKHYFQTGEVREQSALSQFRYSFMDETDIDARAWMETVNESSLQTEAEKELLRNFKSLRMRISLKQEQERKWKGEIARLEAIPEDQRTSDDKRKLEAYRIRLQNIQKVKEQAQEEMAKITSSNGYVSMMYRQQRVLNDFVYGRTQGEVRDAVEKLEKSAKKIAERIEENQKKAGEAAKSGIVDKFRKILGTTTAASAAADLKKQYHSTWTAKQIQNYLDPIILKMTTGEDFEQDIEDLAGILINSDERNQAMDEELAMLRGLTIVISRGQLQELRGQGSSIKEVRAKLAGTGIKVKVGDRSSLTDDIDSLIEEYGPAILGDLGDEKDALGNFIEKVTARMKDAAQGNDYDQRLAIAMAEITGVAAGAAKGIYMPTERKAQQQVMAMLEFVKSLDAETRQAEKDLQDIVDDLDAMQKAGRQASGMANTLTHDANVAIDYFNRMAKIAQDQQKQKTRKDLIEQLKSEHAQKIAKNNEEWRSLIERESKAREQVEENQKNRGKLNTAFKRMYKLLRGPKGTVNVPEHLQGLVKEVLYKIGDHDLNGVGGKLTFFTNQEMQEVNRWVTASIRQDGKRFDLSDLMDNDDISMLVVNQDLMAIYDGLEELGDGYKGKNKLDTLQHRGETIKKIQEAVSEIYGFVKAAQEVNINGKRVETMNAAGDVIKGTGGKKYREWTGKAGRTLAGVHKMIVSGNMTPEYYFRTLGNEGLTNLWNNYHQAENRNGLELAKAKARLAEIAKKHGYDKWDLNERINVKLQAGDVKMTLGQIMSLWATWKREKQFTPEESNHLYGGGFYVEEKDLREGILGRTEVNKKAHKLTEENKDRGTYDDMEKVVSKLLTAEQKAYVDDVVSFMSNEMSELGNEASMQAYGIRMYKEKYYFPFQMWDGIKSRKSNEAAQGANSDRAFHPSFSKSRMHGANNALVIGDFTQTAADHIAGMINYATMGLANESLQKVLNQQLTEDEIGYSLMGEAYGAVAPAEFDIRKRNVRAILEEAYGQEAVQYLLELQKQLNGGAVRTSKSLGDKAISLFRKNAVAGSLSVAIQQPLSYIRAAMMINPKYLTKALMTEYWKNSYTERMAHSGVSVIKDMGRFDMNAGQSAREYLLPDELQSKGRKIWEAVKEYSTILPEKMDTWTWNRMWVAVKAEMAAQHPEMDVKSDEFLDMVGERFNDLMRRTQVYDSVLAKSSNMRSDNYWVKSLTSFMAEPTLTLNVLADAVREAKTGGKNGKLFLAKAGATFLLSAVLQAAFKAIVGSGRTPDEKKTWAENFLNKFWGNLINEQDPLQLIPGFNDAVTLLKDGELSDDAMGAIGKMFTAGKSTVDVILGNGKKGWYRDLEDSVGQLTQLFSGLPAKNIMRDLRAMWNWAIDQPYAKRATSGAVIMNQGKEAFMNADNVIGVINKLLGDSGYKTTNDAYYQRIYEAEKAGNEKAAQSMIDYLLNGKGVKDLKTIQGKVNAIAKKDTDATAEEKAAVMKQMNPDMKDDDIWWEVDRAEYQRETGAEKIPSGYGYRLKDAVNANSAEEIKNAVKLMMDHGITKEKIKSQYLSDWKSEYLAADNAGKVKIRDALQKAYRAAGYTAEDANKTIAGWEKSASKNK